MTIVIVELFLVVAIFCIVSIWPRYFLWKAKKADKELDRQISVLPHLYGECVCLDTSELGLGPSRNSGRPFEGVHDKYQKQSVDAALSMVSSLEN